jgi:hypothetical protein
MLQIKIDDKQYRAFIKYAMATCDSFSLVFEKDDVDKSKYVFQDVYFTVVEFIVDKKSIDCHPDTGTSFKHSNIIYFECNKHTEAILQTANSVLDWDGKTLPEEICFYRNGEKWFVCVCHERYLFIYNETKDDIIFLKKEGIEYWHET